MKMTADATNPVACSQVDIKNSELLAREGYAYCNSPSSSGETSAIYIFGGLVKESGNEEYRETNDLVLYKPSTNEVTVLWQQKSGKTDDSSDEYPSARSGSALAIAGDRLFVFGGFNHSEAWLNDFWTYQLPSGPWHKAEFTASRPSLGAVAIGEPNKPATQPPVSVGTPLPTPRDKATLTAVTTASSTHLWLFGGFGPVPAGGIIDEDVDEDVESEVEDGVEDGVDPPGSSNKKKNDEEKQDPLRLTWFDDLYCINATPNPDGLFEVKKPMQMNLDAPTPRAAHGSTGFVAKNGNWNVVIFGGRDTDGRTNDLSIFDTRTRKWTAYDIDNPEEGDDEEDEIDEEEEIDDEEEMIEDDAEPKKTETSDSANGSTKKADTVVDDVAEQVKRNLEAIRKKTTLAELSVEKQPTVLPPWPEARSYMSVCVSQNRWLFVFGGRDETDGHLNDLWMFDLENPANGWYNLENANKAEPWPKQRSGAILVPMFATPADDKEHDAHCKLLLVGGCSDLEPESMHCNTLFTNAYTLNVNLTAALAMERKPVEVPATTSGSAETAALLKAAKKSVMAAIKGDDIESAEQDRPTRKRSASPGTLEALSEEQKRVRCGADN